MYDHPDLETVSLAAVMHALSDPCRLTIVTTLKGASGELLACNQFPLDVSKATASHHFEILRNTGLIETHTQGTKCLSRLRETELEKRFPGLIALIVAEC